jgi:hypothetical protein
MELHRFPVRWYLQPLLSKPFGKHVDCAVVSHFTAVPEDRLTLSEDLVMVSRQSHFE